MRRKEKVYDGLKDGYKHEKDGEFDEMKKKKEEQEKEEEEELKWSSEEVYT